MQTSFHLGTSVRQYDEIQTMTDPFRIPLPSSPLDLGPKHTAVCSA